MTQMKQKRKDATNETEMITNSWLKCNKQLWVVDAMDSSRIGELLAQNERLWSTTLSQTTKGWLKSKWSTH